MLVYLEHCADNPLQLPLLHGFHWVATTQKKFTNLYMAIKKNSPPTPSSPESDTSGKHFKLRKFAHSSSNDETNNKQHRPVQVNPLHVDLIVKEVVKKENWKTKLDDLSEKWAHECLDQNISVASVEVAFDILRDIEFLGRGVKHCCGCCGANPVKQPYDDEDEQEDEEVDDEDRFDYYSRSTKFCECPCSHCALDFKEAPSYACKRYDGMIPEELKQQLKKEIDSLVENTPDDKLDWHPGSNHQVLDIIHPSLYCYSKKYSQLVEGSPFIEKNKPKEKKETPQVSRYRSFYPPPEPVINYLWMPTNFKIHHDAGEYSVEPLSYINNVDQVTQKPLQDVICKVLGRFIEPIKNWVPYLKDTCQVIIKAATVIVTPEQQYYPGGTWHTEGLHENIVATGIYYYESENVKESYLEFRSSVDDTDISYEQDNVKQAFDNSGLHDGDLLFNYLGCVETKQDRCIVFPNTYQHRVKHFFPLDPTKVAKRKILVFFVVDPDKKIISTSDVDVQRRDFLFNRYLILTKLLPAEVVLNNIIGFLPHMTRKQAEEERSGLMKERKFHVQHENEETFEREFSLCEH
ncbi:hypothetical protein C9374_011174 [Naegleria lovaniensis]|uniref:DUF4246 domain-containing protein n=1 Tax=Naegleria lovaniensis TaxID=51637 RepID=A0AA88GEQ6_NAELO|nr:uncharacterized protein C9374_011174 [Naegleria lovaniensis]KAG2374095.1 hypothetical protein C9374_011174 [Naegleria lovaniensis]